MTSSTTAAPDVRIALLRRYGTNPSSFLALNSGNAYFTEPGIDGFIAYRAARHWWIQFGGPVTEPGLRQDLLTAFFERARREGRRILAVQLLREDAELQMELGYHVTQFGASFSMPLASFTLRGQNFVKTRNMISRARRDGLTVRELGEPRDGDGDGDAQDDLPDIEDQLARIDASWLRAKGRFTREIRFFVGERSGPYHHMRRMFLAWHGDEIVAYVTYSPVMGGRPGWLYDLTRRKPDGARGAIEMTFAFAAERMRAENPEGWLHLGLTPFVGLDYANELASCHRGAARVIRLLADHGQHLYPAATQLAFKRKWRPDQEIPEYLAFEGRLRTSAIWRLMKVANLL
jgi:lysylphosphatidylglycerol synthetase-like protein (DUF2156 family)